MQPIHFRSPKGGQLEIERLSDFEYQLDLRHPERSQTGCRVLGYGEISTVLEIQERSFAGWAFKRMSVFRDLEEIKRYIKIYTEYNRLLEEEVGIQLPNHGFAVLNDRSGRPIFYIIQAKLSKGTIGNQILHNSTRQEILLVFNQILAEVAKVTAFNRFSSKRQIAIDGQISNWALSEKPDTEFRDSSQVNLLYIDTSTPLYAVNGVEQLDPELFLRAAPSFLVWIIRWLFLKDVMTRYYDPRNVILDLIANFYKEKRAELIPTLVLQANSFLEKLPNPSGHEPLTEAAVRNYYREDALIWWVYASMRHLDRFLRERLLRQPYPYILPGEIKR